MSELSHSGWETKEHLRRKIIRRRIAEHRFGLICSLLHLFSRRVAVKWFTKRPWRGGTWALDFTLRRLESKKLVECRPVAITALPIYLEPSHTVEYRLTERGFDQL